MEKGVFHCCVVKSVEDGACKTRYDLNLTSKWLMKERDLLMVSMLLMQNDVRTVAMWHHFN
jgi:hypothetical protein